MELHKLILRTQEAARQAENNGLLGTRDALLDILDELIGGDPLRRQVICNDRTGRLRFTSYKSRQ